MITRHFLYGVTLAAILLGSAPAKSEQPRKDNVQTFYSKCSKGNKMGQAYCLGFISGAARQMFWTGAFFKNTKNHDDRKLISFVSACLESSVSDSAMLQAFMNWARNHPEKWHMVTQLGVMEAIRSTWPCTAI
jgi:Rap1a immunity proteins